MNTVAFPKNCQLLDQLQLGKLLLIFYEITFNMYLLGGMAFALSNTFITSSSSFSFALNHRARYACCNTQVKKSHISTTLPLVLTVCGLIFLTYFRTMLSAFPGGGGRFPRITLGPGMRQWGISVFKEPPIEATTLIWESSWKRRADCTAKYPPAD